MQVPSLEGASKVVEAFGFFPTFHDGEIIDLHLNRNTTPEEDYPTVSIHFTLHGWELTSEITASGHYRLIKHHLIKFQFDHIDGVDLRYFNHQNVISGLSITKIEPPTDHALLQVEFGSCYVSKGDSVLFPDPLLKWSPATKTQRQSRSMPNAEWNKTNCTPNHVDTHYNRIPKYNP